MSWTWKAIRELFSLNHKIVRRFTVLKERLALPDLAGKSCSIGGAG
jgi:hypothetical protein